MKVRIFVRTWWRRENGRLVPGAGRKRTIGYVATEEQARAACARWFAETYGTQEEYQRTMNSHRGRRAEFERV